MAASPPGTPTVAANGVPYAEFIRRKRKNPKIKTNWAGYVQYVANAHAQKQAASIGSAATRYGGQNFQQNPAQYLKQFGHLLGPVPKPPPLDPALQPMSDTQLRARASSIVNPMIGSQADEITKIIQQRSQAGSQAIQGYTNAYLATLPQVQQNIGSIWDEARNLQGAASQGLAQYVQGQGAAATGAMQAAEQQAGQLSTGSQQVAQTAAGSGGATAAADWSTMSRLIGEGAGAKTYAAQLPAIAGAYGASTMRAFQSDLNSDLNDQLSALRQTGSQSITDLYSDMMSNELSKAGARTDRLTNYQDAQVARRQAMAGAYSDVVSGNLDRALAGQTLRANLGNDAANRIPDPVVTPPNKYGPGRDPVTGAPILSRGQKITQTWGSAMPTIASAISQFAGGQIGQPKLPFDQAMARTIPLVRAAFNQAGITGLTEGQLRGFARQALAANGITPATAKKKPVAAKPKPVAPVPTHGANVPGGIASSPTGGQTTTGPGGAHVMIPGAGLPGAIASAAGGIIGIGRRLSPWG